MNRTVYYATIAALTLLLGLLALWASSPPAHADPIPQGVNGYQAVANRAATGQMPWQYARNRLTTGYVDANDTTPDPNAMTWDNTGDYFPLDYEWNTVTLSFFAYGDGTGDGDSNGGSFDCNVYVAEPYGSWEHIASFTVAIGELELTHYPASDATNTAGDEINGGSVDPNQSYKWGEGPFTDNLSDTNAWPTPLAFTGRTNGIGRLSFDPLGARALMVLIDNRASATRIYALVKGR